MERSLEPRMLHVLQSRGEAPDLAAELLEQRDRTMRDVRELDTGQVTDCPCQVTRAHAIRDLRQRAAARGRDEPRHRQMALREGSQNVMLCLQQPTLLERIGDLEDDRIAVVRLDQKVLIAFAGELPGLPAPAVMLPRDPRRVSSVK